jgi:hypothetical protein
MRFMLFIGGSVIYLGLYFVWFGGEQILNHRFMFFDDELLIIIKYWLPGIALVFWGALCIRDVKIELQEVEDKSAKAIIESGGAHRGLFYLYLRPFDTTGKFHIAARAPNLFNTEQYKRPGQNSLERVCADALKKIAPLIGLGGRGEIECGPGSAGLVDDWRIKISQAMQTATFSFIIPSANEGTLWEFGEINSKQLFSKTIIIMPPSTGDFVFVGEDDYKTLWEAARTACSQRYGIDLPEYAARGALLPYDQRVFDWHRADISTNPKVMLRSINWLMSK